MDPALVGRARVALQPPGVALRPAAGPVARVVVAYGAFAGVWILLSDRVLAALIHDPSLYAQWSTYKGWGFVLVTSILLAALLRAQERARERGVAALSQSEERLRLALDAAQMGTYDWDLATDRVEWSPRHEKIWGYARGEFDGTHAAFERRIHPEDLAGLRAEVARCLEQRTHLELEFRVVWPDQSVHWVLSQGEVAVGPDGRPRRLRGVVMEVSDRKRQERVLRHERDFSDAVLNSLPGVLYLYDENGQLLRWNVNFGQATGYTGTEIEAMHPLDFIAPSDRELVADRIADAFRSGESRVEASLLSRDGHETPYYFTGVVAEIGGRRCLVGVGIDVSERRRAEEARRLSEARYRTLFERAPDGIVIADGDSVYLDANASICRMLGYTRDELIGKHAADIVVPAEVEHIDPALGAIKSGSAYHREWRFRRKNGTTFPAEVIATTMPDGHLMGMIRDTTDRQAAETAQRVLNETLEAKVELRTRELQEALVWAEAADRIKSAFLATMSHELRTPLNSIIGFTGIVLQGMAGPLNPEQAKQLGMVRGSARHLLDLINDVLDISKIEAGQLEVWAEPFDLRASVERVVESVRPLVAKKGLQVDAHVEADCAEMVSDRRRVEQILLNLLNNAIKFTDRGRVSLRAERQSTGARAGDAGDPAVSIRVADTGIGIRPEDLVTLFQPFRQLDSGLTRRHEGTGLGLAICRRLAELLGGEISAASDGQRGSAFTVTLPLRRSAES